MRRTLFWVVSTVGLAAFALAGLSLARPDWFPEWARPSLGRKLEAASGPFCQEHGVPEKFCTLCHPDLAKTLLLCDEHGGLPEDICTACHPEAARKLGLVMCAEHGLPESFCAACGHGPAAAKAPDDGWCAEHGTPEELCLQCKSEQAPTGTIEEAVEGEAPAEVCRQPLPLVRLASARLASRIGIQTAEARREEHTHRLVANAETAYDANHYAEVSPRVEGFIAEVRVDLGDQVRQGDVLAVIDSARVGAAKTRYFAAHAAVELAQVTYDRTARLARSGSVAAKDELEARTDLSQAQAQQMDAEQTLRNLGFGDDGLAQVIETRDTRNLLEIVAPIDGAVVARHAVQGEAVQATSVLFAIADTSKMWLWIDVYEDDIATVAVNQPVGFTVSGAATPESPGSKGPQGRVTWVGTEVDPMTRTTKVRALLENPGGHLRANQFGKASIQVADDHEAVVVPRAAVQNKDGVDLVFLPDGPGRFRPQRILARPTDRSDQVEVIWGLNVGQRVVTNGSFLLKTEIMKGAIGAGCCE